MAKTESTMVVKGKKLLKVKRLLLFRIVNLKIALGKSI